MCICNNNSNADEAGFCKRKIEVVSVNPTVYGSELTGVGATDNNLFTWNSVATNDGQNSTVSGSGSTFPIDKNKDLSTKQFGTSIGNTDTSSASPKDETKGSKKDVEKKDTDKKDDKSGKANYVPGGQSGKAGGVSSNSSTSGYSFEQIGMPIFFDQATEDNTRVNMYTPSYTTANITNCSSVIGSNQWKCECVLNRRTNFYKTEAACRQQCPNFCGTGGGGTEFKPGK